MENGYKHNFKTLAALNEFYLAQLNKMQCGGTIKTDGNDSDEMLFRSDAFKMVNETMSILYGIILAHEEMDNEKAKDRFMVEISAATVNVVSTYQNSKNEFDLITEEIIRTRLSET